MEKNLALRRAVEVGALVLIGDGVMGLIKPRWHSRLWHFGPRLVKTAMEELANIRTQRVRFTSQNSESVFV